MGFERLTMLLKKLERLPAEMQRYSVSLMYRGDVQQLMKDSNTDQLHSGLRSDATAIAPPYKPRTVEIKKKKGDPYDRVTLRDTGEYYEGFRVKIYPDRAEMFNVDEKSEQLKEKYGKLIEGLSPFSIVRLREFLRPLIVAHARKKLTE